MRATYPFISNDLDLDTERKRTVDGGRAVDGDEKPDLIAVGPLVHHNGRRR